MAVFTPVAEPDVRALLARLGLGALTDLQGISAGIENTNYFVACTAGDFVLTLFERLSAEQLPFYLRLMQHLAARGLPVPAPCADATGKVVLHLAGKPAALVSRLNGQHIEAPDLHHVQQLGHVLARLHREAADCPLQQPNLRGLSWCLATAPRVMPFLPADAAALLGDELAFQQQVAASGAHTALPRAAVHADLFRDNVLFDGLSGHEKLTGCLDFYFAGVDTLLYDLAVCLNDWCVDDTSGRIDAARAQALMTAYQAERPLNAAEHRLMPAALRAAALRFWLSRLADWHLPRSAALLAPKDPGHFERVLRDRQAQPWHP
ncbi:homoserine kinase, Neisseria type [Burkholderiales bacterium JOSHI_001]|nr:homoserine kinase, Neisseria type [Burkholderiales bacterium JOSHI_001]